MIEENVIEILESNYQIFKQDFDNIDKQLLFAWPETRIYKGDWLTFGLYYGCKQIYPNVNLCLDSVNILNTIPGLVNAGYSVLKSRTYIKPHVGYTNKVYRYHLGIDIPTNNGEQCGLIINNEKEQELIIKPWVNGKAFRFDDCKLHSAHNYTNQNRTVLIIDILK